YGVEAASQCLCGATGTFTATRAGDCNDLLGAVNPAAAERCNQVDDDCDGQTDERDALGCTSYLRDVDNDNFGITGDSQCLCAAANPYRAVLGGDCADGDATRNPGQTETCNGKDDDCNGSTDPDGSLGCFTRYRDGDGDTYGLSEDVRCLCTVAAPYSASVGGDCNDSSSAIKPGVTEVCNGKDDNCDGRVDEAGSQGCTTYYLDADGDRYGVAGQSLCLCAPQAAYSATVTGDCDDGNAQKNPARTEACNTIDDDCDGQTDETGALGCALYWTDADSDTYGITGSELCVCAASGTRTAVRGGDCDDTRSTVSPARAEVCDSIDNNCDAVVDDANCGLPTTGWPTFMRDARRSGHPFFIEGPTDTTSALRWKKQLVANTSFDNSPVIDEDGNIYILLGTKLFKLDPNNGNTLWQKDLPATPFPRASPTARVGGTLLVPAGNRVLLYAKDGTLIWTADFGGVASDKVMGSPVVDQSGAIYVVSNTHIRSLGPTGNVLWATAITADTTKSADPAIGPDGRIYFTGTSRVYSFAKTGTKNWDWCPLSGGNCDATKTPGTSVTVNEIGRVLAPMGNTLYLLADAQTQATQVSSLVFTTNGGKLWANLPIFSTGYTCCNPEEYPLATPAGSDGLRALTASMAVEYTKALNKRDQANGAGVYDRDGDIFIGNNNSAQGGKARFSARKNRDAGSNASTGRGTEYWGYDVDGAHIDGAPALGGIGNIRYVVFGDSSGTIYQIGK
ncbi:MAG: PQQ-binding-like beta-propeller repeat protein, partial [Deltaproteobacteria bacterium]|nr:PQQ-binding-like beta-propeller repeat protein [Deltaproteobacteria bacterium]